MMQISRFAKNKAALSRALDLSRVSIHRFLLLPGAPRKHGEGYNIAEMKRFIASHTKDIRVGTEKEKLQIVLLKLKIEREQLALAQENFEIREAIYRDAADQGFQVIDCLATQVRRMPDELSGRFSGMEPMEISKLFKSEINQRFQRAHDALQKMIAQSKRKTGKVKPENVVPLVATGGTK
jgi:hypothetical protein